MECNETVVHPAHEGLVNSLPSWKVNASSEVVWPKTFEVIDCQGKGPSWIAVQLAQAQKQYQLVSNATETVFDQAGSYITIDGCF